MADQDPKVTDTGDDRLKNLQAEMQRKIDNQAAAIAQSSQETKVQLDAIMAALNKKSEPAAQSKPNKKLSDMLFDDPDAAINQIAQEVGQSVTKQVMGQVSSNQQLSNTAAALENEYPEFSDRTSEHYKRVQAHYNQLPQGLQGTPQGLENAAYRAAAEFGLIPKSRRQTTTTNDDFSVSSSAPTRQRAADKGKTGEMKPEQAAFAQLLGAPVNDPKFKEIFKKASNRTEWNKYKGENDQ